MTARIQKGKLAIAKELYDFIENEALPGSGLDSETYWKNFEQVVVDLSPKNKALLAKRDELQAKIDEWHRNNKFELGAYKAFLTEIGYLLPEVEDFQITTENVDEEIALLAGPQLVVPVRNARYCLNAANARWGSLYDALYGFDVISEEGGAEKGKGYNPVRGAKVIEFAKNFLNEIFPLAQGSHADATKYAIEQNKLVVTLKDGTKTGLAHEAQFVGFNGEEANPSEVVLLSNGLHVIIEIDANSPIGQTDLAGVKDLTLEAAVTTIQDLEDSVAAVDAEEKVEGYRNWLGLMKGTLQESIEKNGKTIVRALNKDREIKNLIGGTTKLHGRSLMLLRNVGHLMTNPAILVDGEEIFEGIMDALVTPLLSIADIRSENENKNSRKGSMYIVKPKMHGPEEVAFAVELFERAEQALGLPAKSLKIGIMDEERRTSVNLKNCIAAAKDRTIFINTGFMDRTGDEIHTSMEAAPVVRKEAVKTQKWIAAYENRNVAIGLKCGLQGKAQIGKGMWPKPDSMKDMLATKAAHPNAGASCAWVPSPTGAVLHAMHYHQVNVKARQDQLKAEEMLSLDDLLTPPFATDTNWSAEEINNELENNCQGILGYVVRWVDLGVGCSKVPDINNVGLMEDRATLRISSQHVANWLRHGIVTREQVEEVLKRMAKIVDEQNANDPLYKPMAANFETNIAFQAASDLIFKGCEQPSGYTEPLLHAARLKLKGYTGD
ncbi:TPA: malate synthase G [Acinetobacter baumannii]|jgi:malate synthase|uniref:Malate synthase G n=47 Tax=Gammaproteobacteria TaxID=1236 RepID=D0C7P8_ACIB2|nr:MULTISPECIES: malate synthase G [Acinetobacter]ADX92273.1 malate synthase G [Acinetobacter baumannii TCDC-AB0715]AHX27147.1 malate synthase [Acinetobacter baumannii AC12]AHX64393.1 malate synthase [Acinetobacter baumannii AC30]EMT92059.1 malate synthase G [Acinetobacter baumannii ABNIH5]EMT95028.1 malate synthase G [Acinetobacter baumannii ABNIH6]EXB12240.1 malate synthase G [Acinetobacter baumannii 1397084]EXD25260.1 malate synthase G [Acinetobacter baumannii 34654]EXG34073.1 malate syn